MGDLDYEALAQFSKRMFERSEFFRKEERPIVLDLACGTGNLTLKLQEFGYDLIGLDISSDMLEIAREQEEKKSGKNEILWLAQDMVDLDLFGTVAAMVCGTDGINHIIGEKDLKSFFKKVYNFLEYSGIFVFDSLSERYFKEVVGNNTYCVSDDFESCIWQSTYNEKRRQVNYNITTYEMIDEQNKVYKRFDDIVIERAWTHKNLEKHIKTANLEIIDVFSSINEDPKGDLDLRSYYVVQKKK